MSTKINVGNLPAGTTKEHLAEVLAEMGAPVLGIEPVEGIDPDNLAFLVELDIDRHTAQLMVDRRKKRYVQGREVRVFVSIQGE